MVCSSILICMHKASRENPRQHLGLCAQEHQGKILYSDQVVICIHAQTLVDYVEIPILLLIYLTYYFQCAYYSQLGQLILHVDEMMQLYRKVVTGRILTLFRDCIVIYILLKAVCSPPKKSQSCCAQLELRKHVQLQQAVCNVLIRKVYVLFKHNSCCSETPHKIMPIQHNLPRPSYIHRCQII